MKCWWGSWSESQGGGENGTRNGGTTGRCWEGSKDEERTMVGSVDTRGGWEQQVERTAIRE